MSEVKHHSEIIAEELLDVPEIREAAELSKECLYSFTQLEVYDKIWDSVSIERSFISDAKEKGKIEGKIEGKRKIAVNLLNLGVLTIEQIAKAMGLKVEEIEKLKLNLN